MTVRTIELDGADAQARGRSYGEQAAEQIAQAIDYYGASFLRKSGLQWPDLRESARHWVPLVAAYAPDLLDEMKGIAVGAGVEFEDILLLNGRGELNQGNAFAAAEAVPPDVGAAPDHESIHDGEPTEGCTTFAVLPEATANGHLVVGQNWDWRAAVADTVVVLRITTPGKPTIITQVEAGQVGRHGANSAGISLNANGLGGRWHAALGVPGTLVRRRILESWDMHDALTAACHVQQAYSTNLLIAHRDGIVIDLETTPGRVGWIYPTDGILVHGNHFQSFVPTELEATHRPYSLDSLYRVGIVERGLRRLAAEGADAAAVRTVVRQTMADHFSYPNSVCSHSDSRDHELVRWCTIMSSLVDLQTGDYHVTTGVPCRNDYQALPWNLYDGPSVGDRTDLTPAQP